MDSDWLTEDGMWILTTVAIGAALFFVLRRWGRWWVKPLIDRMTPAGEDWSRAERVIDAAALWAGSAIILAGVVLVSLALADVGLGNVTNALESAGESILGWLRGSGVRIGIIIAVAVALQQIARSLIPHMVWGNVVRKEKRKRFIEEAEQRAETLSSFLVGVAVTILWIVAVFMALPEFNVNIGPLLAGAGIVGIAIGFGAQGLIRDFLSGIFIILEDQYAKGDWVQIGNINGEVEFLGLRRTVLRDFDGTHHTIPNGEVKVASNYSKDWACVNMDVSVSYNEDLDRVAEVINEVCQDMAAEDAWRRKILQAPTVLRVQNFGDSGIALKVWGTTKPMMQWGVMGEIRRRLKRRFDEEGIEIPWPHVKLYFGEPKARVAKLEEAAIPEKPKRRRKRPKPPEVRGSGETDGPDGPGE